jgi:hypothetical protein
MLGFTGRLGAAVLIAALGLAWWHGRSVGDQGTADPEAVRKAVLGYLDAINLKSDDDLTPVERKVKTYLANKTRLQRASSEKLERRGDTVVVDVWRVDIETGEVSVTLTNPTGTHMLDFRGKWTGGADGSSMRLTELSEDHRK